VTLVLGPRSIEVGAVSSHLAIDSTEVGADSNHKPPIQPGSGPFRTVLPPVQPADWPVRVCDRRQRVNAGPDGVGEW